ncbi:MAG TPA: hypothetical protein VGI00_09185 [Streptosporangiaceae bacterium]|jgi:hypothetical protein
MRKKLAIGAMALAAAAVAGCSSGGSAHDTSAASSPTPAASSPTPAATTGPATGTAACNAINSTLNTIMGGAAKATPAAGSNLTKQQAMQAKLAVNLGRSAQAFTDDQSQPGITTPLKQAEQVIAANATTYAANYSKPDSGTYGLKIINALNQVKKQCGTASWQTAI